MCPLQRATMGPAALGWVAGPILSEQTPHNTSICRAEVDTAGGIRTHTSRRTEAFEASVSTVPPPPRWRPSLSLKDQGQQLVHERRCGRCQAGWAVIGGGQLTHGQPGPGGDERPRGVVPQVDAALVVAV